MFEFAWPWAWLLLPLPWLVHRFSRPPAHQQQASLSLPFFEQWNQIPVAESSKPSVWVWRSLLLCWFCLVAASSRPLWLGEPLGVAMSGRNLLLAIDVSESMRERDFSLQGRSVSRLAAVKRVADSFIAKREGDRIGLLLFADKPYTQAPLTFDHQAVRHFLSETLVGLAGKATAMGDAIGLGVKLLRDREKESRVLILLSDGANTAGVTQPLEAARLAAELGVRIHTISVGSDSSGGFWGLGGAQPADEKTLKAVADLTGGRAFSAANTEELTKIYQTIEALEPVDSDPRSLRVRDEWFVWPLLLCLFVASLLAWKIGTKGGRHV